MGFQYTAKSHSDDTHRLPIPPNAKGEKNYQSILKQIHKFMGKNELAPLFTLKENIPMIKSFLHQFCEMSEEESRHRVYPLHELFFVIKEEAAKNSVEGEAFQSIHIPDAHLNRDQYIYLRDTACNVSCD